MRNKVHKLTKKRIIFPALILAFMTGACAGPKEAVQPAETFLMTDETPAEAFPSADEAPERSCYVHVCGAVKREGVYELPEGARVFDAIDAAGGLLEGADGSAVNQAQPVTDGSRLRIPFEGEQAQEAAAEAGGALRNGLIDINTASEQELQQLTGIGEKRARDIVRYRETHGAFLRIEDLMQVDGIKQKLFDQIREMITV
ncbi:MAG: ComEA family DNA-binding protein [Lachnospiraceae bacterium]|nr:ComEA family DNA-binding protein [Lachnospiraceae bacterium]